MKWLILCCLIAAVSLITGCGSGINLPDQTGVLTGVKLYYATIGAEVPYSASQNRYTAISGREIEIRAEGMNQGEDVSFTLITPTTAGSVNQTFDQHSPSLKFTPNHTGTWTITVKANGKTMATALTVN